MGNFFSTLFKPGLLQNPKERDLFGVGGFIINFHTLSENMKRVIFCTRYNHLLYIRYSPTLGKSCTKMFIQSLNIIFKMSAKKLFDPGNDQIKL